MKEFKNFESTLLRNNIELSKNKFGRNNSIPNSDDILARRDYLLYRLGASFNQLSMLKRLVSDFKKIYDSQTPKNWERIETILNSENHVSYCFDNMIFNLASMSDYFGNYLGIYLYGAKFQSLKWNGFVNKTNEIHKDSEFGKSIAFENREWFTKIHGFRGDIIHRKALKAQVEGFTFTTIAPQEVPSLNFLINEKLKKYFHIFRDNKESNLYTCAETICKRTLSGMIGIMEKSEAISFDPKHHWMSNR